MTPEVSRSISTHNISIENKFRSLPSQIYLLTILSMMLLPIIPIWGIGLRLSALIITTKKSLIGALKLLLVGVLVLIGSNFLANEHSLGFAFKTIKSVYGIPFPLTFFLLLSALDGMLLTELFYKTLKKGHYYTVPLYLFFGFVLFQSILSPSTLLYYNLQTCSVWTGWGLCFFLSLQLIQDKQANLNAILNTLFLAGVLQSIATLLQWALKDFSYSIIEIDFYRSSSTFYYYSALDLGLILSLISGILLYFRSSPKIRTALGLGIILIPLYFNGSRALSLCIIMGCLICALYPLIKLKKWTTFASCFLIIALIFSTQVTYIKDSSNLDAKNGSPTQLNGIKNWAESYTSSNQLRLLLLQKALHKLWQQNLFQTLFGAGTGNIHLVINTKGDQFDSDTSHGIILDIFLATGLLGGGLFFTFIGGYLYALRKKITHNESHPSLSAITFVIPLTFVFTGLFFKLEHNYTVNLFFTLFAIGLTLSTQQRPNYGPALRPNRLFITCGGIIILSFVVFLFLISPSYFFPYLNFYQEIKKLPSSLTPYTIQTNNSASSLFLKGLVKLHMLPGNTSIKTLSDNTMKPLNGDFIFWNIPHEYLFPKFIKASGLLPIRPWYMHSDINMPLEFSIVNNHQKSTMIYHIGGWYSPGIPLNEAGKLTRTLSHGQYKLTFWPDANLDITKGYISLTNGEKLPLKRNNTITVDHNYQPSGELHTWTHGDIAYRGLRQGYTVQEKRAVSQNKRNFWISKLKGHAKYFFDFTSIKGTKINFYALTPAIDSSNGAAPTEWTLSGSNDNKNWIVVDNRTHQNLKLHKPYYYIPKIHKTFQYYRLSFKTNYKKFVTLNEIEIYD